MKWLPKKIIPIFFLVFISVIFLFPVNIILADDADVSEEELRAELNELEKEIAEKESLLKKQKNQTGSIQQEIKVLTTQIEKAKLNIQAKNLTINKLKKEIDIKSNTIAELDEKIENNLSYLGESIRMASRFDQLSATEMMLGSSSFSEFYADMDVGLLISGSIRNYVSWVKDNREELNNERNNLKIKQDAETDAKMELENTRKKVEQNEKQKNQLLSISKNKEQEYQKLIKEREKKAAEIRAALFALRDVKAIPFGDALVFAEEASAKTGVRPALILAVLQQESNMGANVGTCNRPGDSASKHWTVIMPGPKDKASGRSGRDDQSAFVRITNELGIPQEGTPLSCPWGKGWGGAMGPSQFIPTTWELFKNKISNILGIRAPNPWEPKHAITATAIYLMDLGAGKGGYTAERNAACRYYSGRPCDNRSPANSFYGDQVVSRANNIQNNMIDPLKI